jgi:outer membrane protein assembly factor BamE (lipoprotein component of BamABCDE complex)
MKFLCSVFLLICLLSAGCVSMNRRLDSSAVKQIKAGVTTEAQVRQLLGSPDQVTRTGSGYTTYTYMFMHGAVKPQSFIPVVGALGSGVDMHNQFLTVTFGPNGIVKDFVSNEGASEVGTGLLAGRKPYFQDVEANKRPRW